MGDLSERGEAAEGELRTETYTRFGRTTAAALAIVLSSIVASGRHAESPKRKSRQKPPRS